MTDLEPALRYCDIALKEADLLMAMLSATSGSIDPELSAVRLRIAALRHEVERLRGMPTLPARRKTPPDRDDLSASESPWASPGDDKDRA